MKYHVTYDVERHNPPISKEEIPKGRGATNSLVILSLIEEEDGGASLSVASMDGKTGKPVTPENLWKMWVMTAPGLMNHSGLDVLRKGIARALHEMVIEVFVDPKPRGPN